MQNRGQIAAFDDMGLGPCPECRHEGGGQIDHLDQRIAGLPPGGIGLGAGICDDQRHFHRHFMVEIFVTHPMIAHVITVIRGKGDDRILGQPLGLHPGKKPAQVIIKLLDQPHIGGNDRFAHLVTRKAFAHPRIQIGAQQRVIGVKFGPMAHRRHDVAGIIHIVVGCGHDIGPMRLDIGQMAHPWPPICLRLAHEIHGAIGHIGGFGMFFGHICRQTRVFQQPGRQALPIGIKPGIGKIMPWVIRSKPMRHQIIIVGRPVLPRAIGVQAIVTLERIKAAFRSRHTDLAFRVYPQPGHPLEIGGHVGFAHQNRPRPGRAQVIAQCRLAHPQRHSVPGRAMAAHIAPRIGRHTRRPADRRLHIGVGKAHAARGQSIDMGGMQMRMAIAAEVIKPQLIGHDPQHIGWGAHLSIGLFGKGRAPHQPQKPPITRQAAPRGFLRNKKAPG